MRFDEPTREAEFIKRYKRFFADVRLGDEVLTTLVPNTGSLKTCLFEGSACVISDSSSPTRKLKSTLQFLRTPTSWVGVNTSLPNALVEEAWQEGLVPDWRASKACRMEYKISKETRLDMVLGLSAEDIPAKFTLPVDVNAQMREANAKLTFVEVKNVTMAVDGVAQFPDAVTTRGQKHLVELMTLKKLGYGAEIVFVIQRQDCATFSPADQIDPDYGRLLREARTVGVVVRAFACDIDPLVGVKINPAPIYLKF